MLCMLLYVTLVMTIIDEYHDSLPHGAVVRIYIRLCTSNPWNA